jgi:hypothetical protein
VASLAIPHRIADTQIAIEVDGVGKSIPETPNFLQASRYLSVGKTGVRRHSWAQAGKESVRY